MKLRRIALHFVRWMVRNRVAFFIATLVVAVLCAGLIPHIHIHSDMTHYLPDGSAMKQGMEILDAEFPGLQEQAGGFSESLEAMPKGLGKTIIIGVALVFAVLLMMCSSVLEVVIFLITVGVAVLINVGSNALLDGVSMMTNTISPVLQMVLSMDYCIILMNRYRDERLRGRLPVASMNRAVGGTATSILSSAFTTIVSLLMLCLIKLKIGSDLGIVLAKGVAISLICNFTLLPALIIWCRKAIEASRKKVPVLPAGPLSRFEHKFRIPITIVFAAAFVGFTLLQLRTPLFFGPPQWDTEETDNSLQQRIQPAILIYSNADEPAVPALLDSIAADPKVRECISYPSLAGKPLSTSEVITLLSTFAGDKAPALDENMLKMVYYAHEHPVRSEKYSLKTLQQSAEALQQSGMVPAGKGIDIQKMIRKSFTAPGKIPGTSPGMTGSASAGTTEKASVGMTETGHSEGTNSAAEATDNQEVSEITETGMVSGGETPARPAEGPTYEQITTPLTAAEMAAFLPSNPSQVSTLYRMAGKKGGKMTPVEFIRYVRKNIVGKKFYAAFLPKGAAEDLAATDKLYQKILEAGPTVRETPPVTEPPADSSIAAAPAPVAADAPAQGEVTPAPDETLTAMAPAETRSAATIKETPLDRIIDMYVSGKEYAPDVVSRRLRRAGIAVSQGEAELLYLYTAARLYDGPETRLSPETLLNYLADTLLVSPAFSQVVDDSTRAMVTQARDSLLSGAGMLRGPRHSVAVVLNEYEIESDASFAFVDRLRASADQALQEEHYWISESEMYKELKDGFPEELLLLTLLTILSIYIIVAINFRSVLTPIPLIMTVLAGVYANVWASGLGGHSMYYLSYLIVQGILMGATIDYSILFTSCFLSSRQASGPRGALEAAYRASSHSILTSGVILALVPLVMSFTMPDMLVASILRSLSLGAFAVLILILFLLPGVLALLDPLIKYRKKFRPKPGR